MICQKGAEVFSAPFFVFDFKSEALPKARAARREPQGCLPKADRARRRRGAPQGRAHAPKTRALKRIWYNRLKCDRMGA